VVADLKELPEHGSTLSVFTNEAGGIVDDTIINKQKDHFYIVSNAGCSDKDIAHITEYLKSFQAKGGDARFEIITDTSLLAIQGKHLFWPSWAGCWRKRWIQFLSRLQGPEQLPRCRNSPEPILPRLNS
jgi:hypothetical protein